MIQFVEMDDLGQKVYTEKKKEFQKLFLRQWFRANRVRGKTLKCIFMFVGCLRKRARVTTTALFNVIHRE